MPPVGFEPTISAGDQSQTYAFDRAATGAGSVVVRTTKLLQILIHFVQIMKILIKQSP